MRIVLNMPRMATYRASIVIDDDTAKALLDQGGAPYVGKLTEYVNDHKDEVQRIGDIEWIEDLDADEGDLNAAEFENIPKI